MIEKLPFGRTGHLSTRTLFGAAAFWNVTQEEADRTMEILMQYGVNHIDTAASYGDSEIRLGPWIEKYRDQFFLATKTGERTREKAREEIYRSLERLRTDHVDLIQLHAVIEDGELEQALGPGGALEAALEAREEGLVKFIGITSHTLHAPVIHLRALECFDFDSILLPCNFMLLQNPEYAENFHRVLTLCREKNVAVQCIKTLQRRPYGDGPHTHATWYQPFDEPQAVQMAVHWALAIPGIFINTVGDIHVLPLMLEAAANPKPAPSDDEMRELMSRYEAAPLWA
ncbi:aldo/keto reductase [Anaerolinea thermophila]|uniref:aldo/keto reductase n=1 Tax=Anaerolinea thermophila TaxID=167964 RepID=UPI0026EC95EC|nr:aldo/keto reductase [Anaerolinea thermophila]